MNGGHHNVQRRLHLNFTGRLLDIFTNNNRATFTPTQIP